MSNKIELEVNIEKLIDKVISCMDDIAAYRGTYHGYDTTCHNQKENAAFYHKERASYAADNHISDICDILGMDMTRLCSMARTIRKWNEKCNWELLFPYWNCGERIYNYLREESNTQHLEKMHYKSTGRCKKYMIPDGNRYFFTFGSDENQPYQGGWVEVYADTLRMAQTKFRRRFPDVNEGVLNCADFYTEQQFARTGMAKDNRGKRCHEVIR